MQSNSLDQRVFAVVILAGLLAIGFAARERIHEEAANGRVALAVDYQEVSQAAALSGVSEEQFLRQLKQAGVSHLAITERNLQQTLDESATLTPGQVSRIRRILAAKAPGSHPETFNPASRSVGHPLSDMFSIGVGYDEQAVQLAKRLRLRIIARPAPDYVRTAGAIDASLKEARGIGSDVVVFSGPQVMGYKGLVDRVAEDFGAYNLQWGMIELVPQLGADRLARALNYSLIRTHSVNALEMADMQIPEAVQRFSLAARERKVRLCYVRLSFIGNDPAANNTDYIRQLSTRLQRDGLAIGSPHPYGPVGIPLWLHALMVSIVVAGAAMLYITVFGYRLEGFDWWFAAAAALAALLSGIPWAGGLLAALIFPTLGVCRLRFLEASASRPLLRGIAAFIGISLVSLFGGLLAAAQVTDMPHLLGVEVFRGVKLAELLPVLLVGLVFAARSSREYAEVRLEMGQDAPQGPALWAGLREMLSYAVRYWQAIAVMIGLGVLAMLLMRSGNETQVQPSGIELRFRILLDAVMGVRPRTKEFLFGHPVMLVSLALMYMGRKRGVWIGLAAGMIGQVSIVNTFCHLHTPLIPALTRGFHGLWLGLLCGLVLWAIITLIARRIGHARQAS